MSKYVLKSITLNVKTVGPYAAPKVVVGTWAEADQWVLEQSANAPEDPKGQDLQVAVLPLSIVFMPSWVKEKSPEPEIEDGQTVMGQYPSEFSQVFQLNVWKDTYGAVSNMIKESITDNHIAKIDEASPVGDDRVTSLRRKMLFDLKGRVQFIRDNCEVPV